MALADIPGYGAYAQRRQMNQQQPLAELQQVQAATGLMDKLRAREQDESFRVALAQSGGDVEKALEIAIKGGNVTAATKLAPLARLAQEKREAEQTRQGLTALMAPTPPAAGNPMVPGPGASVMAGSGDVVPTAAPQPSAAQRRLTHLDGLTKVYATNPTMMRLIEAERGKLTAAAEKPTQRRERISGDTTIQEEFTNGRWQEIGRGPRFARQVTPTAPGEQGTKPPSGYQWKAGKVGGELEAIPGGPRDKPPEKALPTSAAQKLFENQQNLRRAQQALALVQGLQVGEAQGDKDATGLKGYLPEAILQRVDPAGVETRAAIADLGSLVIHDRSGAAVTAAEYPRLRPFIPLPTDDTPTVTKKLQRFATEYEKVVTEMTEFFRESGYRVPSETLRPSGATPPPAPPPAAPAASGWTPEKERRLQELRKKRGS